MSFMKIALFQKLLDPTMVLQYQEKAHLNGTESVIVKYQKRLYHNAVALVFAEYQLRPEESQNVSRRKF